jgi:hypothetical protein
MIGKSLPTRAIGGPLPARIVAAAAIALFAILAAAPARADAPGCPQAAPTKPFDTQWPINIGLLADRLIVYRCTDYIKDAAAELAKARAWVETRAAQVAKPAVVFDIDETTLSNWEAMYHNRFAYVPNGPCDLSSSDMCGQREWELSARAVALAPTLDFYRFLKTLKDRNGDKVAVFFVTGRYEDPTERIATEWNLRKEGYDTFERLYMRAESTRRDDVSTYKTSMRKDIEKDYVIIANIGDQYSDLIGDKTDDHAERCFKLPNPFYFIGPALPDEGLRCLAR